MRIPLTANRGMARKRGFGGETFAGGAAVFSLKIILIETVEG